MSGPKAKKVSKTSRGVAEMSLLCELLLGYDEGVRCSVDMIGVCKDFQ